MGKMKKDSRFTDYLNKILNDAKNEKISAISAGKNTVKEDVEINLIVEMQKKFSEIKGI
ncbi:MAG: hypothetical protein PF693_04295 [Spirochaetia bacterium]|nr:hypothetical protein [Spirochaetia bacterium]